MQMMTPPLARRRIDIKPRRGKHPLPPPPSARIRILPGQRPRQLDPSRALGNITLVLATHPGKMVEQGTLDPLRQQRQPVAVTLAGPHRDLVLLEIDVLDPQ